MEDQKRVVRPLTDAEKEQLVSKARVEFEDIPESKSPVDIFKMSLNNYLNEMAKQIGELYSSIHVHKQFRDYAEKLLDKQQKSAVQDSSLIELYKAEISSRDMLIQKLNSAIVLMKKRIDIGNDVINFSVNHYSAIEEMNFFLGNPLGLSETQEKMESVVKENVNN